MKLNTVKAKGNVKSGLLKRRFLKKGLGVRLSEVMKNKEFLTMTRYY